MRRSLIALTLGLFLALGARAAEPIKGLASWYGKQHQGKKMANGKPFDKSKLTAAHKRFPLNTLLLVTFQGRSVVVRVTDRGPYVGKRILDLSEAAATVIGLKPAGVGEVEIRVINVEPEIVPVSALFPKQVAVKEYVGSSPTRDANSKGGCNGEPSNLDARNERDLQCDPRVGSR